MLTMQAAPPLHLSDEERSGLERLVASSTAPHHMVLKAKALLLAAEGVANYEIARRCGTSANSVREWRKRFPTDGVGGLSKVRPGRGRKSWLPDGTVAMVMKATLEEPPPDGSTHWSTRSMASHIGIGKDTVQRIWANHEVKPWRVETFKLSNDPHFEDKLVDVVGLYMNPPERAVVYSFDEKTQVQALDRTQPSLPLKPGRAGTMTHDYKRNGTTDLFAALNVATGEVLTECRERHTGDDVLAFFKKIDRAVPRRLEIHVVLDNLSAHQTPDIQAWLADPKRTRWHLHFTPTSSSWLNLVERFFAELTNRRLRRGTFTSVSVLIDAIESWIAKWNEDPKPFVWHKAADEIIEKVRRGRAALAQVNSATRH
jgi:transposase